MAVPTNTSVRIETDIFNDASKIIIADKCSWESEAATVKSATISIASNTSLDGYSYALLELNGDRTAFESFVNGLINIAPSLFKKNNVACQLSAYPDGRYEITLTIVYANDSVASYTDNQGFIPFVESAIQRVQLDLKGKALERFVDIHIYAYGAKSAASVGKIEQFDALVDAINARLNHYNISYQ